MRALASRIEWPVGWLLWVWCAHAYAQASMPARSLADLPFEALGYGLVLSLIGGLTSSAHKIASDKDHSRRVAMELLKGISGALVAGLVVFSYVADQPDPLKQIAPLTLAGYLGVELLDRVARGWLDRVFPPSDSDDRRSGFDRREQ